MSKKDKSSDKPDIDEPEATAPATEQTDTDATVEADADKAVATEETTDAPVAADSDKAESPDADDTAEASDTEETAEAGDDAGDDKGNDTGDAPDADDTVIVAGAGLGATAAVLTQQEDEVADGSRETDETTAQDTAEDAGAVDAPADKDGAEVSASDAEAGTSAEPASLPPSSASAFATPVVQEKIIERKGGFFPMLLGGVVAAGIGFGAAQVMGPDAWPFGGASEEAEAFRAATEAQLAQQSDAVAGLGDRLDGLSQTVEAIDLAGVQGGVDALGARVDTAEGGLTGLGETLAALDSRLTALEKRPVAEAVSPEAIAAYERELEELRVAIETQREEIQTMAADAVAAEQAAEGQAQLAAARAAMARLTTALESGDSFADPLAQLGSTGEVAPPPALSSAADEGIPTLAELAASFPSAARAALAEARAMASDTEDTGGRLVNFMRSQLGARSVTPRDGDDPDAVLSRAEAAVTAGELQTALDEISSLPDPAKAALSDWTAQAQTRLDALAAADALMQELNKE